MAIDGQHQRSKRPSLMVSHGPPLKPVPKPAQGQSWLPHSPLEKTPHKTGNGELSITCSDRHCPKCQSLARAQWLEDRQAELLNTQYFHVVFTLPQQIASIAYQNKRELYGILFRATAQTLLTIAADPKHLGAEIGFFAVLHTWGSNLLHHPHLHCVVPGGDLSPDGTRWISCQAGFFLPVRVLSRLFRRLFLDYLLKAFDAGKLEFFSSLESLWDRSSFLDYLAPLREAEWVVYAKPPFAGPEQVLDYVGRYTHRVAISNNRLLDIEEGKVTFRYKDYRHDAQQKTMILEAQEFIRRFLLHVLPRRDADLKILCIMPSSALRSDVPKHRYLRGTGKQESNPLDAINKLVRAVLVGATVKVFLRISGLYPTWLHQFVPWSHGKRKFTEGL
jgi:Putative transposase/Transposase zinc-binding domain